MIKLKNLIVIVTFEAQNVQNKAPAMQNEVAGNSFSYISKQTN